MSKEREEAISFVLDGRPIWARKGDPVIRAAEEAGTYIPRFCYHPRMKAVGMCRMCLVEIKGPRGFTLQPACFVQVSPDMEVITDSVAVRKAQDGVLEYLLANHPLDCPVCDKGGECPLQDQTLAHGPGESRYVEEKRHFAKPIEISSIVLLDRERCIQCGRCTRFAGEVVGKGLIDFAGRGANIEVAPAPGGTFDNYFSGNIIQICPVGALTSKSYRFKARPWDLEQTESTCTSCAMGCRVVLQSSQNEMTRVLGIDSDAINHSWLCDKGRFAFEATSSEDRVLAPYLRKNDNLVEVGWFEALTQVAKTLTAALEKVGPATVAAIGGGSISNEDAFAWAKLLKGYLSVDSLDCQPEGGVDPSLLLGGKIATFDEVVNSKLTLLLGADVEEEMPVLYLRLREALLAQTTSAVEIIERRTSLSTLVSSSLLIEADEVLSQIESIDLSALAGVKVKDLSDEQVVVVVGQADLLRSSSWRSGLVAKVLQRYPNAKILPLLQGANTMGAVQMGMSPGLLPGGRVIGKVPEDFPWPNPPKSLGRNAADVLSAAAADDIEIIFLLGPNPLSGFPDKSLVRQALERSSMVVAIDSHFGEWTEYVDVVLPLSGYGEYFGSITNAESRVLPLGQSLVPAGVSQKGWEIAVALAESIGYDLGFESESDIWEEIQAISKIHRGFSPSLLSTEVEGVVVPRSVKVHIAGRRVLDPVATPGISSVKRQAAPLSEPVAIYDFNPDGELVDSNDSSDSLDELSDVMKERPTASIASRKEPDKLRLHLARKLYGYGVEVASSPTLSSLVSKPKLRLSSESARVSSVEDGDVVRIISGDLSSGEFQLEVSNDVVPGVLVAEFVEGYELDKFGSLNGGVLVKVVKA
ncbi:NADH-quinone oxidoreductase subunit G [Ferrithrix thermotolerans DSM 19514]|uniref:NADH-quinone oxidoreductase n=1 Tax=Ferrithrix thermotolerans DSM 19514 TaxID=1121881 RepID=A0A1M4SPT7_9ACTN|nr:NADH-quinone oxidoreductase subunit NuoG [Ferrithrix thermotolerans]SHE34263.1 NADH-quinone oxidoreductase subunit G [Ferrithrix thermotolerans DSM 19514]